MRPSRPLVPYSFLTEDLQYEILGHLNAADLKAMTAAGCHLASKELLRRFTSILVQFYLDPDGFRACMKTCGVVVSGSTALAILLPRSRAFHPNDIDIYVNSEGLSGLLHYLHTNTPYTQETILTRARRSDDDYSIFVRGTAISSYNIAAFYDPALLENPALSWHLCEYNTDDLLEDVPSVAWKLAHDGLCSRTQLACPGWLEDVDGRRSGIVTGF
ncbi:hypothetical protein CC1G_09777 [Coprinopsis cinerea okayama7|uniref:Uncharacterized protein n=1 Tax=Coprinopsis cinerea (strain Okayama-7 / 130 / ATCC MYA-4618 / FGSC 9003) TaxID=240176 RepID=A8PE46_COPC7|nr:hypothetical protein CC1G_09777 [Coprinopsis cinerea okayama7\|eukprot:XP_001840726.2 hypothetical protein CC1G_09777 [Coprinopsis cinerea okayama7\